MLSLLTSRHLKLCADLSIPALSVGSTPGMIRSPLSKPNACFARWLRTKPKTRHVSLGSDGSIMRNAELAGSTSSLFSVSPQTAKPPQITAKEDTPVNGKCYAVLIGRQVGIFSSSKDAKRRVSNYAGAMMQGFDNLSDAEGFLNTKHIIKGKPIKFYGVRNGHTIGVFTALCDAEKSVLGFKNARWKSFSSYSEAKNYVNIGADASYETEPGERSIRYYAVRRGRKTGIFESWEEAREHTDGFRQAEFKSFSSYQEAESFMKVKPPVEDKVCITGRFYAVRSGGSSGIFETVEEADRHTKNFSCQERRRFDTFEEAKQFIHQPAESQSEEDVKATSEEVCDVYTDGSSRGNGQAGAIAGIGVFYGDDDPRNVSRLLCASKGTSNSLAELEAVVAALYQAYVDRPRLLNIHTDSEYVVLMMTVLGDKWKSRKYCRGDGKPIPNAVLIKKGHELMDSLRLFGVKVELHQVKGHSDNYGNVQADKLANQGAMLKGKFKVIVD